MKTRIGRKMLKDGRKATFVYDGRKRNAQIGFSDRDAHSFILWHNVRELGHWEREVSFSGISPTEFKYGWFTAPAHAREDFPELELI